MNYIRFILLLTMMSSSIYSWSIFTRLKGGYSFGSITSPDGKIGLGTGNAFSDTFEANLQGSYVFNDIIYDGYGNHSFLNIFVIDSNLIFMPSDRWEITLSPEVSLGKNLSKYNGYLEIKFNAEKFYLGAYGSYGQKSYLYSDGITNVNIGSVLGGAFYSYYLNDKLDLNLASDYSWSLYNTSGSPSSDISVSAGVSWNPDEKFTIGADVMGGTDSSDYTMYGFKMNIFYKIFTSLALQIDGDYRHYSNSSANSPGGKSGGKSGNNAPQSQPIPVSNRGGRGGGSPGNSLRNQGSSSNEIYVSMGVRYILDFSKKDDANSQ